MSTLLVFTFRKFDSLVTVLAITVNTSVGFKQETNIQNAYQPRLFWRQLDLVF